jgi:organic radical activating enzyme
MKIIIMKKGIVDCTSDSRTHEIQTLREGIEGAIKIVDKEVLRIDRAEFYIKDNCKLTINNIDGKIEIADKKICLKLLNYFKDHPDELLEREECSIHIHIELWNFFNDGNNCSDTIDVNHKYLEVSCQDEYDPEMREEFHENIEELLGSDYAVVIDNDKLMSLHICVTEKCSANCDTCYINRGLEREFEKEYWNKLPPSEQFAIGGGEPAEYPLISEFVDYLKNDRNGYVAITTNGQKRMNFNTLPDKIAVSIDGLTKNEHEIIHATDLDIAKSAAKYYKDKGIKVCINHVVHKGNIDNAEKFAKFWVKKGYEVNFILFTGQNNDKSELRPTYEQLYKFKDYFLYTSDKGLLMDSCMGGLLNLLGYSKYQCCQGLFSKYYRYGSMTPCSHSALPYPGCKVMEEYMIHFFKILRPMIFVYGKDGTSGAHEWAFKAGYKGKIAHNVNGNLRKDTIHVLTDNEEMAIKESHYVVYFRNKMPSWLYSRIVG